MQDLREDFCEDFYDLYPEPICTRSKKHSKSAKGQKNGKQHKNQTKSRKVTEDFYPEPIRTRSKRHSKSAKGQPKNGTKSRKVTEDFYSEPIRTRSKRHNRSTKRQTKNRKYYKNRTKSYKKMIKEIVRNRHQLKKTDGLRIHPIVALLILERFEFQVKKVTDPAIGNTVRKVESAEHWFNRVVKRNPDETLRDRVKTRPGKNLFNYLDLLVQHANQ
jgi:hypothetical protein